MIIVRRFLDLILQDANSDNLQLWLTQATASVVGGQSTVTIPSDCASRCVLITDLRENLENEVFLPLPLSIKDVRAWLACVNLALCGHNDLSGEDEGTLLHALKAADFLQDNQAHAAVTEALAQQIVEELGDACPPMKVPDADVSPRTSQIITAVPPPSVLAILSSVRARHEAHQKSRDPKCASATAQRLLLPLPRTFHPAVVRACCTPPSDPRCCSLDGSMTPAFRKPLDAFTAPPPRGYITAYELFYRWLKAALHWIFLRMSVFLIEESEPGRAPRAAHDILFPPDGKDLCTKATLHLLAAAAPLAGGSLERAMPIHPPQSQDTGRHAPDDPHHALQGLSSTRRLVRAAQGAPCGVGSEWWQPGAALTRLDLTLPLYPGAPVAPRHWCAALVQLRTLRAVSLRVTPKSLSRYSGEGVGAEFMAALRCLPDLTALSIEYSWGQGGFPPMPYRQCFDVSAAATVQLLGSLSRLPQLTELNLLKSFTFATPPRTLVGECDPGPAIAQLMQVSQLTRLSIHTLVSQSKWTAAFARTVKQLPALCELHAELCTQAADDPYLLTTTLRDGLPPVRRLAAVDNFLEELVRGAGLPALSHLHCAVRPTLNVRDVAVRVEQLHTCMRRENATLLARLTALRLGLYDRVPEQPHAVPALIADMHALQSLHLEGAHFDDRVLRCLAAAEAVPALTARALTHLALKATAATEQGLLAVLRALAVPRPPEGGRHCRRPLYLDISGHHGAWRRSTFESLAALIGGLRQLEHLVVDGGYPHLGLEGLQHLAGELQQLPRLRRLHVPTNFWFERKFYASPSDEDLKEVFAGLGHITEIRTTSM